MWMEQNYRLTAQVLSEAGLISEKDFRITQFSIMVEITMMFKEQQIWGTRHMLPGILRSFILTWLGGLNITGCKCHDKFHRNPSKIRDEKALMVPNPTIYLTHWGWVRHIFVNKITIIGSDNGLSTGRHQAIIWTNAGILLIDPRGTNFSEIFISI